MIIRNQEHYLWYGIQHSKCYLQRHFETYPIISNVTTHCPKAHYKCLWKPKYLLIIKVHEGWKPMATCVVNVHFVGWTQPSPMGPAHMSKPSPKNPNKKQRIENGQPALIHSWPKVQMKASTREPSLWGWTRGCPISFLSPSTWREQCPEVVISAEV